MRACVRGCVTHVHKLSQNKKDHIYKNYMVKKSKFGQIFVLVEVACYLAFFTRRPVKFSI